MTRLLFILGLLFSVSALADLPVRILYSSSTVGTVAWVQIVSHLSTQIESLSVLDTSGQTMELGFSRVLNTPPDSPLLLLPIGGGGFPQGIDAGTSIWIKSLTATANSGEADFNFFYK